MAQLEYPLHYSLVPEQTDIKSNHGKSIVGIVFMCVEHIIVWQEVKDSFTV